MYCMCGRCRRVEGDGRRKKERWGYVAIVYVGRGEREEDWYVKGFFLCM